ncbi:hypothetical protein HGA34_05160 [Candidatus Falkowbacteria bacterium]|nr:hypothetical protein [Candidatus Falkowbacteria bacterium]
MAKIVKNAKEVKLLSEAELDRLVELGTKEAQATIKQYIKSEKDEEKRELAQRALAACEAQYYEPRSSKEEQEFILCKLISMREREISELEEEAGQSELELDKLALEKKVHELVLAKHKDKQKAWASRMSDDLRQAELGNLKAIEDDLEYEKAWVAAAKRMITVPRYKGGIEARHFEHYDFLFDEEVEDCCGDDCGHHHHCDDDECEICD